MYSYEGSVCLVTGGAGAIGGNLVRSLSDADKVVVLDDFSSAYEWNVPRGSNVEIVKGSIVDDDKLVEAFRYKPRYVFHLAAHFANQNSVAHPRIDLEVNLMGTLKLLEMSSLVDVERFVFASSSGVYGPDAELPLREEYPSISPDTPYQLTKLAGEMYANYFYNLYGLPVVNARLFSVFGPGEVPGRYRNVIPIFFYQALKGMPLTITGTGNETRDWTFVSDVVRAFRIMGQHPKAVGDVFNVGQGLETTVRTVAENINMLTGNPAGVVYKPRRVWDKETRKVADVSKITETLGWRPEVSVFDGLRAVYEWFVENWELIERCADF